MSQPNQQEEMDRSRDELQHQLEVNRALMEAHLYYFLSDARIALASGRRETVLYEIYALGMVFIRDRLQPMVRRDSRYMDLAASVHATYPMFVPQSPSGTPSPSRTHSRSSTSDVNHQSSPSNDASPSTSTNTDDFRPNDASRSRPSADSRTPSTAPPLAAASPRLTPSPISPGIARQIARISPSPAPTVNYGPSDRETPSPSTNARRQRTNIMRSSNSIRSRIASVDSLISRARQCRRQIVRRTETLRSNGESQNESQDREENETTSSGTGSGSHQSDSE